VGIRSDLADLKLSLDRQLFALGDVRTALDSQTEILKGIRDALVPKPAAAIRFTAVLNGIPEVGIVSFQLQDIQSVPLTLSFVDADGNPAAAPAGITPTWATSDATKVTVTPAADGLSAVASGQSGLGDAQISVTAGSLTGQLTVTVVAGPPASITITPGAPTPAQRRR